MITTPVESWTGEQSELAQSFNDNHGAISSLRKRLFNYKSQGSIADLRTLSFISIIELETNNLDGGIADLVLCLNAAKSQLDYNIFSSYQTYKITYSALITGLRGKGLQPQHYGELLEALRQISPTEAVPSQLRADRQQNLSWLATTDAAFCDNVSGFYADKGIIESIYLSPIGWPLRNNDRRAALEVQEMAIGAGRYTAGFSPSSREAFLFRGPAVNYVEWRISNVINKAKEYQRIVDLALAGCSCELWLATHKSDPLTSAWFEAMLTKEMSRARACGLIFRPMGREYKLYTVGRNNRDDHSGEDDIVWLVEQ